MPLKVGNIIQAKVGSVASTDTAQKALFTLPAQAQIVDVKGFSDVTDATGVVTLYARPINSPTAVAFATLALTAGPSGIQGVFTNTTIPYNRQSVPVVITAAIATPTGTPTTAVRVNYM